MYAIARKSNLCMNLNRMRRRQPEAYSFYPKTWFIPAENSDLQEDIALKRRVMYIAKPEASSQGKGIFLFKEYSELKNLAHYIIQKYIERPLLIDGLKFDLRIYVLITSCNPLRVFIHEEGLARFATEVYRKPNEGNKDKVCMHLTNYAVNRRNPKFQQNVAIESESRGHKRSMASVFRYLQKRGCLVERLWDSICDLVIKTICTIQPNLAHTYQSCHPHAMTDSVCFEILGFDILIDSKLKPWLLEVNHSPSFTTDSPIDKRIKERVIKEALTLINVSAVDKLMYRQDLKIEVTKRSLTKQSTVTKKRDRECRRQEIQLQRDKDDEELCGGYIKVFPGVNEEYYNTLMKEANEIWESFTGSRSNRIPSMTQRMPLYTTKSQGIPSPKKPGTPGGEIKRRRRKVTAKTLA